MVFIQINNKINRLTAIILTEFLLHGPIQGVFQL
jgi:hypothetical protein